MKKKIKAVLLLFCVLASLLLTGCNKEEKAGGENQGNGANQGNTGQVQQLEPKTLDEFSAMLVEQGMLKKASDLIYANPSYSDYPYYHAKIAAPSSAGKENMDDLSIRIEFDPDTKKVVMVHLHSNQISGEATPYHSELKASLKIVLQFMNSGMTEEQTEEMIGALDPKGINKKPIIYSKYGFYCHCEQVSNEVSTTVSYIEVPWIS